MIPIRIVKLSDGKQKKVVWTLGIENLSTQAAESAVKADTSVIIFHGNSKTTRSPRSINISALEVNTFSNAKVYYKGIKEKKWLHRTIKIQGWNHEAGTSMYGVPWMEQKCIMAL